MRNNPLRNNHTARYIINFLPLIIIVAILLLGVFIVSFLLSNNSHTKVTNSDANEPTGALYCTSNIAPDAFFDSDNAISQTYEIKIFFASSREEHKPDKISYSYMGTFDTHKIAERIFAQMQVKYSEHIGEKSNALTDNFSIVDNKIIISLYSDFSQMSPKNASLFFLDDNAESNFFELTQKSLREYYAEKGFLCKAIN